MMTVFSQAQIQEILASLPDWRYEEGQLATSFTFANFVDAMSFMTLIAFEAEKIQHHPDWRNCYNVVDINLSTHDVQGITLLDTQLANFISQTYQRFKS